mmetsp:Transcript_16293/g.25309  ORF Transcript_16293/g.25309 Transcript_16293/m.25309 type:complete len:89 (-) Transcript_16293:348-614(-)
MLVCGERFELKGSKVVVSVVMMVVVEELVAGSVLEVVEVVVVTVLSLGFIVGKLKNDDISGAISSSLTISFTQTPFKTLPKAPCPRTS